MSSPCPRVPQSLEDVQAQRALRYRVGLVGAAKDEDALLDAAYELLARPCLAVTATGGDLEL